MSSVGHTGANASDDKLLLIVDKIGGGQRNTSTDTAFRVNYFWIAVIRQRFRMQVFGVS